VEFAWNSSNLAHDAKYFVGYVVVFEKAKYYMYNATCVKKKTDDVMLIVVVLVEQGIKFKEITWSLFP
jgi:hypothetical protein